MDASTLSSTPVVANSAVLIYMLAVLVFAVGGLIFWWIVSPRRQGDPDKLATYECGEVPEGSAWIQFNVRFYVFALVFVIFDVEAAFLLPWAVVFKGMEGLAPVAFFEGVVFILILVVALAYVWRKGDLAWVRPEDRSPGAGR